MTERVRLAIASGDAVALVTSQDGKRFEATSMLEGSGAVCVAVDPANPSRLFVGTFDQGIYRSIDGGASWEEVGDAIPHKRFLSVSISSSDTTAKGGVVYAGTEPSNLYQSEDDGASWEHLSALNEIPSAPQWSFPPRPWTHHVRCIALHHTDPDLIIAGIELGGVMRSTDRGERFEDHKPGAYADSHVLLTHPIDLDRIYEAAGGGTAQSSDRGETWMTIDEGLDHWYAWGLAVDPENPELSYCSTAPNPMRAHGRSGDAQAALYRRVGDRWERLGGDGLPRELPDMPYALAVPRAFPGSLFIGFHSGALAFSRDAGESWEQLEIRLPAVEAIAQ